MDIKKAEISYVRQHAGGQLVQLDVYTSQNEGFFFQATKLEDCLKEFGEWYKKQS